MSARNESRTGGQPRPPAAIFAALGDETRLLLISRLCNDGPMSITRLTSGTNVTRQAITKHLEVMRKAGLVRNARRGRERIWQLEQQRLKQAKHCLELISKQWDDALGRLQKFVEE
ncbi:MAG TPA: metalloregulator ArsR/SmtB family transcription factor [Candidatus Acidoferrum sp.]|nr:metalloregulator ArsR/SmtB family transcription factor [Candidatus Acidoferrum sp.]